jgi:ribonuclease P protein component
MNHFPKGERLKSRKKILYLLHEGNIAKAGPIKIVWGKDQYAYSEEEPANIQTAFSVPKRKFKRAVKRNRIRRKMKEIFRLNRQSLNTYLEKNDIQLNLLIIYLSTTDLPYREIEKHLTRALNNILESLRFDSIKKYQ